MNIFQPQKFCHEDLINLTSDRKLEIENENEIIEHWKWIYFSHRRFAMKTLFILLVVIVMMVAYAACQSPAAALGKSLVLYTVR